MDAGTPEQRLFKEENMTTSPRLAMAYIATSQAQKEVTHNDALNDIDFLAQPSVISRSLTTPPTSPNSGDTYIIAASPTGAWSGYGGSLAAYYSGWKFKTPKTGWIVWSVADNKYLYYTGSAWSAIASPTLDATFTWNPGAIAMGAGVTSSAQTVTGAALGDFAVVAAPYDLQGVVASAYVSAASSVVVRVQNGTGASVTLASGTWRVRVTKA
jgi:hypothetical protein